MRSIPAVLAAVIVTVISIMVVTDIGAPPASDAWEFDDYRVIPGAVSASGALEVVDVDGTSMVHASSVGRGSWTDETGEEHGVNVRKARLDVVLYAGQSNSTYLPDNADAETASPVPPIGEAWVWATSDGNYNYLVGTRIPQMLPMVSSEGVLQTASQAPAFASEYIEASGNKLFFVCTGWVDRAVATFVPGNSTWEYMVDTVGSALDAVDRDLFDVRALSYVWIQGESNKTTPVDVYKDNFLAMHEAILAGELGITFDVCVMGLPASKDAGLAIEAQRQLAAEHSSIVIGTDIADTFTVADGLLASDDLHYTQKGCNIVGAALGTVCGQLAAEPVAGDSAVDQLVGLVPLLLALGAVLAVLAAIFSRRY